MSAWPSSVGRLGLAGRILFGAALIAALVWLAGPAFVQGLGPALPEARAAGAEEAPAKKPATAEDLDARLKDTAAAARVLLGSSEADGAALEGVRAELIGLRAEVSDRIRAAQTAFDEANQRLKALGPAPAEGAVEPPELADHRASVAADVAEAQVPLVRAQEAASQIDGLTREIDHEIWRRVSVELRAMGPSPLVPRNWIEAAGALRAVAGEARQSLEALAADDKAASAFTRTLPRSLALVIVGVGVTFVLRRRLTRWTERALGRAASARAIAWLVALRNLTRLLVPAVGAVLLFAALDPALLLGTGPIRIFHLPRFVLALIGAGWLASSVFAPRLRQFRLIPLGDGEARRGARLTHLLGLVLAAHFLILDGLSGWQLSPATNSVLHFPLTLAGGIGLWRVSSLVDRVRRTIAARDATLPPEQRVGVFTLKLLGFLERAVWLVGLGAPALAAVGFFAASQTALYPTILTLGLLAAALVLFDLMNKTIRGVLAMPAATPDRGLGPVVIVTLLVLVSAPLLALVWGARPSDIAGFWLLLREGGTLGGIHLSLGNVVSFVGVLLIGIAITRAAQSVLVGSVLPRTRLDIGGKTAVTSGIGYLGYGLAALAAISATGLDLSNIAIVAGALSVGIGFGLQTIVSNFVSGIILLVERPVKEGDWIEVGAFMGYVRRISVRATEIETFDRASVILPNSDLISGTVLNRTHSGMVGRIQVPVSVTYDADPKEVSEMLLAIAEDHPLGLRDPAPVVLLMNLGPDTMDFEIRLWLRDVNFSLSARSDINFAVIEQLIRRGIRVRPYGREFPAGQAGAVAGTVEAEA
ncbi:mechanosensitive ion channel domain-containing protein [Amaricoccus solimangrovi]|uniref:Mechanosensitive ion channel family protein n=1 Tax=Amaricoccus solimangrovi TaxID=2589815 RepID=A0A501WWZ1_9RHOB|nr:mechanosensitive ion channel domain-containing protein [Amaricoccus solimangrovi]TPE51461.1 mechanosensitive ion channel family protein [Amaricoccus solimangrovi]